MFGLLSQNANYAMADEDLMTTFCGKNSFEIIVCSLFFKLFLAMKSQRIEIWAQTCFWTMTEF